MQTQVATTWQERFQADPVQPLCAVYPYIP